MTLNARNRMDRDRKLIFFIVGMGVLLIAIGLSLLLLYKLYGEDVKDIRPVIVIGIPRKHQIFLQSLHNLTYQTNGQIWA